MSYSRFPAYSAAALSHCRPHFIGQPGRVSERPRKPHGQWEHWGTFATFGGRWAVGD